MQAVGRRESIEAQQGAASDRPPSRREAAERAAGPGDSVRGYLRAIASYRLLASDEQRALFERLGREREAFLQAAVALRETAEALVRRWVERREAGLVTANMSAHHREGGRGSLSGEIDSVFAEVAGLLRRSRRSAPPGGRRRSPLDARIAARLRDAELAFDVVAAAFREAASAIRSEDADGAARIEPAEAALASFEATRRLAVEHNLRLVIRFARQYAHMGVDLPDLIQEGNLGLIRAVEKFDPGRGLMFSTYAAWWLHQAMIRAIQRQSRTVRPPSNVFEDVIRYRRAEMALRARSPHEPNADEVAGAAGLSEEASDRAVAAMTPVASTHSPLGGREGLTIEDTLADGLAPDPGRELDRRVLGVVIPPLLSRLSPRERSVIEARFGLGTDQPESLAEIGQRLQLSRERVRQIEVAALSRLRKHPELARLGTTHTARVRALGPRGGAQAATAGRSEATTSA